MAELQALTTGFGTWVDAALRRAPTTGIAAFSFNLYEHEASFAVELVGCPTFTASSDEWALGEVFAAREPLFELPHAAVGNDWEAGLAAVMALVRQLVARVSEEHLLRRCEAVAVGFVDGDLHVVWRGGPQQN